MLVSNSSSSSVSTNKNLNKNRSNIYKHKALFFKNPDSVVLKLEVISKGKQKEIARRIEQEKRIQRTADVIMIVLIIATISGVLICLL